MNDTNRIIFSPSEGFWNNTDGWVAFKDDATYFAFSTIEHFGLPITTNNDAKWIEPNRCTTHSFDEMTVLLADAVISSVDQVIKHFIEANFDLTASYQGDDLWLVDNVSYDFDGLKTMINALLADVTPEDIVRYYNEITHNHCYYTGDSFFYIELKYII